MKNQADVIKRVEFFFQDRPKIVEMFKECYNNTLETTLSYDEQTETSFMVTGDIPAMWLRDSVNQLRPYLLIAKHDKSLQRLIEGVIKKLKICVLHDPYANAFNEENNNKGHQTDLTKMTGNVWERKYEIDSLCSPIQLSYLYWKNTGKSNHFDDLFFKVILNILDVWEIEQEHFKKSDYTFQRPGARYTSILPNDGKGTKVSYTGMTWSGFRPSDDRCEYGYLIPSNMFATVVLNYILEINNFFYQDVILTERVQTLRNLIQDGIKKNAVINDSDFGEVYAYEVDGLGDTLIMDDANVPSLLSLPYIGYCDVEDEIYQNTRKMILSKKNPYYFEGEFAKGIGSPHTHPDYIWHISLAVEGMTSSNPADHQRLLDYFEQTDADTNLVHEGFHKDDPFVYTREWFSWSNAMFVEYIMKLCGLEIKTV